MVFSACVVDDSDGVDFMVEDQLLEEDDDKPDADPAA